MKANKIHFSFLSSFLDLPPSSRFSPPFSKFDARLSPSCGNLGLLRLALCLEVGIKYIDD
jgi:hypothetical protein